jgi:plasmid replication initiation protein
MSNITDKPKKEFIVQSNEITEAAYHLSIKAKRVIWICLSQIRREAEHNGSFVVNVSDYQRLFKVSGPAASQDVKDALSEISKSTVKFYPKDGDEEEIERPWLAETALKRGRGSFRVEFNTRVMPYVQGLTEQFTSFYLAECGKINNSRTMRLYESCCQFRSSGIWVVSPAWLVERYQLPKSQKENFAEMKRSFLEPSIERINKETPLRVGFSVKQDGSGKVEKVIFTIVDSKINFLL